MANPTKLVRWLPQIAEATAEDVARFGPQAARVRSLIDFIPTMSPRAFEILPRAQVYTDAQGDAVVEATRALDAIQTSPYISGEAKYEAAEAVGKLVRKRRSNAQTARNQHVAAQWGAVGEAAGNLITPENYRLLTNPLATARAYDVLRRRYPDFYTTVADLSNRSLVTQPSDLLTANRLTRLPKSEKEMIMEVIDAIAGDTGYADTGFSSLSELIEAARNLG